MIKNIGSVLSKYRTEKGISQKELAGMLRRRGVDITNQAVSKWENGTTQPNAAQFIELCRIFDIRDVIDEFSDSASGGIFFGLNMKGKELAREYISLLKLSEKYRETIDNIVPVRRLPLYNIAASAGTGQFLDSSDYETVEVGVDVQNTATFGVRLSGDSMEPEYNDGDVVWVAQKHSIDNGEIGIFLWDGNVYCKKLEKTAESLRLVSLNRNYTPIEIQGDREFRVFGKVVGRWNMAK